MKRTAYRRLMVIAIVIVATGLLASLRLALMSGIPAVERKTATGDEEASRVGNAQDSIAEVSAVPDETIERSARVWVFNATSGCGIRASVAVLSGGNRSAVLEISSNDDGSVTIPVKTLEAAPLLRVSAPEFFSAYIGVEGTLPTMIGLIPEASMRVRVVDEVGVGVRDAIVEVERVAFEGQQVVLATRCTADGIAEVGSLNAGTYMVTARHPAGSGMSGGGMKVVSLTAGESAGVSVVLKASSAVCGRVVDETTDQGVGDVHIVVWHRNAPAIEVVSASDGTFEVPGVGMQPGLKLLARATGYQSVVQDVPIPVSGNGNITANVKLKSAQRLRVRSVVDGMAAPDSIVRVFDREFPNGDCIEETVTDESGECSLWSLREDGKSAIVITASGRDNSSIGMVELFPKEALPLIREEEPLMLSLAKKEARVTVSPGAALSDVEEVRVALVWVPPGWYEQFNGKDGGRVSVSNAHYQLRRGDVKRGMMTRGGHIEFSDVAIGRHCIVLEDYPGCCWIVEVRPGDNMVSLVGADAMVREVDVTVTLAEVPESGASVEAWMGGTRTCRSTTGPDGSCRLSVFRGSAEVRIIARSQGGAVGTAVLESLEAGSVAMRLGNL